MGIFKLKYIALFIKKNLFSIHLICDFYQLFIYNVQFHCIIFWITRGAYQFFVIFV